MPDDKKTEAPKVVTPTDEQVEAMANEYAAAIVANLKRNPEDDGDDQ